MFQVRLVNDVPGYDGLDVCIWGSTAATGTIASTKEWVTMATGPLPFRGVSPYQAREIVDGLDYAVALYAPGDITTDAGCPDDPSASGAPTPVLLDTITGSDLTMDTYYSAIATGFGSGTLGADAGSLPSICNPGSNWTAACGDTAGTQLVIVADDQTAPAASMARLRVSNMVPNIAPVGFNVCYDPDLIPDATMPGHCTEPASTTDPSALFSNVSYGTVTDYSEIAPIGPANATLGIGGGIYLVPEATGSTGCPAFGDLPAAQQSCYPIMNMFPAAMAPPSDQIQPKLSEGDISTLFISGALGLSGTDAMSYGPAMFVWQDNYTAP